MKEAHFARYSSRVRLYLKVPLAQVAPDWVIPADAPSTLVVEVDGAEDRRQVEVLGNLKGEKVKITEVKDRRGAKSQTQSPT